MNNEVDAESSTMRGAKSDEALGDVSDDAVWRGMRKHELHLDLNAGLASFAARRCREPVSLMSNS
jgi:hypothetical protein